MSDLDRIHQELGIDGAYAARCGLPEIPEGEDLVTAGTDIFDREVRMDRSTLAAWQAMQQTAAGEGVILQLISAYRSIEYQKALFGRKLQAGQGIENILQVNAAPGFSEHHSGRALDIGCPGYPHLEESFESSAAYAWLLSNAAAFGFRMSYPRGNTFGVLYEPWHWYYQGFRPETGGE